LLTVGCQPGVGWRLFGGRVIGLVGLRAAGLAGHCVNDAVRGLFRKRFETQGAYGGTRWAPLSESTMRKKSVQYGREVMQRTGTLWASLAESSATGLTVGGRASSRAFGYAVLGPRGETLAVGSTDPVLHLTEGGTRKMPARPLLPDEVPAAEVERWADLTADSLLRLE